jgi:hypothetical protein
MNESHPGPYLQVWEGGPLCCVLRAGNAKQVTRETLLGPTAHPATGFSLKSIMVLREG